MKKMWGILSVFLLLVISAGAVSGLTPDTTTCVSEFVDGDWDTGAALTECKTTYILDSVTSANLLIRDAVGTHKFPVPNECLGDTFEYDLYWSDNMAGFIYECQDSAGEYYNIGESETNTNDKTIYESELITETAPTTDANNLEICYRNKCYTLNEGRGVSITTDNETTKVSFSYYRIFRNFIRSIFALR